MPRRATFTEYVCLGCRHHRTCGKPDHDPEAKLRKHLPWPRPRSTDAERYGSGLTSCLDPRKWVHMTEGLIERVYMRRGLLI